MIYETYIKETKIVDYTDEEKDLDLIKCLIKTFYEVTLFGTSASTIGNSKPER